MEAPEEGPGGDAGHYSDQQAVDSECEKLLRNTKKQVKQMMEEAVTKKFIDEESSSIMSLCVAVDACLSHGLKRRALGLFKTSSSMALVQKLAKDCPEARQTLQLAADEERRLSDEEQGVAGERTQAGVLGRQRSNSSTYRRNMWIRCALIDKKLVAIVEHLAENWKKYYEPEALMASLLCSQLLCSLLMGPSALEFRRSFIHAWRELPDEPSARELLERHELSSPAACLCPTSATSSSATGSAAAQQPECTPEQRAEGLAARRRPLALNTTNKGGALVTECRHSSCQDIDERRSTRGYSFKCGIGARGASCPSTNNWSPRMLHETLHQSSRSSLLYAKNNVQLEGLAGYLSLHDNQQDLLLKWIPNDIINGGNAGAQSQKSITTTTTTTTTITNTTSDQDTDYLELVLSLPISRVALLHCQLTNQTSRCSTPDILDETSSSSGFDPSASSSLVYEETLVLVEADGIQRAPIKFPQGGLRLFLACLDGGLAPERRLELVVQPENGSDQLDDPLRQPGLSETGDTGAISGSGRLDQFLKRLPSLRRLRPMPDEHAPEPPTTSQAKPDSVDANPKSDGEVKDDDEPVSLHPANTLSNYVYRIIPNQPMDWIPLTTPPHSAVSASSSSGGPQSTTTVPTETPEAARGQRFRWSLSRLTRISTRRQPESNTSSCSSWSGASWSAGNSCRRPTSELPSTSTSQQGRWDSQRELARVQAKLGDLAAGDKDEPLSNIRTQSVQALCESMRRRLVARAFYGWLAHCRRARIIRDHLTCLVKSCSDMELNDKECNNLISQLGWPVEDGAGLTSAKWHDLMESRTSVAEYAMRRLANKLVYFGGIESDDLRRQVWPCLLGHYEFGLSDGARQDKSDLARANYEACNREWIQVERVVRQRDREILAANMARARACNNKLGNSEQTDTNDLSISLETNRTISENEEQPQHQFDNQSINDPGDRIRNRRHRLESTGSVGSDASITEQFANNIHRIDKDVQRCDRNFWYFKDTGNLDKLRNVMCSYVWQHLDVGYVQGMCDLAAPFLVIFDDEALAFSCFSQLMRRMVANFPHGSAMDQHFQSLKYLMQVLDPKLFNSLQDNGDYTHFYFCYRWLLLDFKRELAYEHVYRVWETIWSACHVASEHFVVFMALAMVRYYRDIIIENNMDSTDTIKFFNEMAERHDAEKIISLARDCIAELQNLIKNA